MNNKYRKKPVEIEAIQWNGENYAELQEWSGKQFGLGQKEAGSDSPKELIITTLEGNMRANEGDWIIKGVKGEFYPCKPDIFEATYERTW